MGISGHQVSWFGVTSYPLIASNLKWCGSFYFAHPCMTLVSHSKCTIYMHVRFLQQCHLIGARNELLSRGAEL